MEQNQNIHPENFPHAAEESGNVRNDSASFRTLPNDSEAFGKLPNGAERFGRVPHNSERKDNHTLTVREAARMFESAGVARTERSIVNWCQPNRTGVARLDAYYDPNERKYYISPQSVELAIAEEKAKVSKLDNAEPLGKLPQGAESFRTVPNHTEPSKPPVRDYSEGRAAKELENEIRDLQITNKAKDMYIDRMEKERDGLFEQVITASRKVGELENRLLQLEGPKP